jgi:beta-lactamase class A
MELPDQWNAFGGVWSYAGKPAVNAAASVSARVNYRVNCAPGRAGAALINVTTGETVLSHADQWFGTASACKVWVLYALLRKADAEGIDLDTTVVASKTLTTLATEMIVDSNNASTNTLIDYVGMDQVNEGVAALGFEVSGLQRYMTGGKSAHGLGNWFDDFKAGYDNFSTPRELATFWKTVYENDGLLSADAYSRFLSITKAAPADANDAWDAGYYPAFVDLYDKSGSKLYTGSVGDFAHRPQLDTHRVRSEGGAMQFIGGDLVFYAVISDQADPLSTDNTTACVSWEFAKSWAGTDPGTSSGICPYP